MLLLLKKILNEFHFGNPDISRIKGLMYSYTYWSRISKKNVNACRGYQLATKAPPVKFLP